MALLTSITMSSPAYTGPIEPLPAFNATASTSADTPSDRTELEKRKKILESNITKKSGKIAQLEKKLVGSTPFDETVDPTGRNNIQNIIDRKKRRLDELKTELATINKQLATQAPASTPKQST